MLLTGVLILAIVALLAGVFIGADRWLQRRRHRQDEAFRVAMEEAQQRARASRSLASADYGKFTRKRNGDG